MIAVDNLRSQHDCDSIREALVATPGVRGAKCGWGQLRSRS